MTIIKSDLSSLRNPYDFANPVKDVRKLYGRDEELKLIDYYLEQSKINSDPINLAILGERASGKTSLLNAIEQNAISKGICTCRINLDESDIESEIKFFFKIYDAIFSAVCESDGFGGSLSPTYLTYLDMISSFQVPEIKDFCPLLFPIIYATSMSRNNTQVIVSDAHLIRDLKLISKEAARPIAILIDEGNVMATHKTLLQKIRNIFMNINGYMLTLVGTPEIFSTIDDVFSPITRQFIKINIEGFVDENSTARCLREPLEDHSYQEYDKLSFSDQTTLDIHDISSGKPYEIQYIAHHMFKSIQDGRRLEMVLDSAVLRDIREELEKSQNSEKTLLIDKYFLGESYKITALSMLSLMEGKADLDEIIALEYMVNGQNRISPEELLDSLIELKNIELFAEDNKTGVVKFIGDQFEKIYLKYASIDRGTRVRFSNEPKSHIWVKQIMEGLKTAGWRGGLGILDSKRYFNIQLDEVLLRMENIIDSNDNLSDIPNELLTMLYSIRFSSNNEPIQKMFRIVYENEWSQGVILFDEGIYDETKVEKYFTKIEEYSNRIGEAGKIEIRVDDLKEFIPSKLIDSISMIENSLILEKFVALHIEKVALAFFMLDLAKADIHIDAVFKYSTRIQTDYNTVGYIAILRGKLKESIRLFNISLNCSEDYVVRMLLNYNLAIAHVMLNENLKALENITETMRVLDIIQQKSSLSAIGWMLRLESNEGEWNILSVRSPDNIPDMITELKERIEDLIQKSI